MRSCLFGVIFCVYCPHCPPKRKIIVNIYLWVNVHFIQAEYHEKNKAITTEETHQIWKINSESLPGLLKLFIWWRVGGELGRLPLSRICYIVAREMKHKLKVAWDVIVYKMQLLLTRSNEPGLVSMILDSWIWTLDFDLATLDDIRYHRIWYIIVYYCILEQKSIFQPKYHCSQHFQFSVNFFQTMVFL